jgi:hypothetical protein
MDETKGFFVMLEASRVPPEVGGLTEISNSVGFFAIEEDEYPYVERSVRISWSNLGDSMGVAAIKNTIDNFVTPLPIENGSMHIGSLGAASIGIPNKGKYILVVWIHALASRDGYFPKYVYFTLILKLRPYKVENGRKIYKDLEPIISSFLGKIDIVSDPDCGNYTGPCQGIKPNIATLNFKNDSVPDQP